MTTVTGYIHSLESKAWHGIENFAASHPNAARWLGIATAIATLVKDILFPPVRCIENAVFALKRYTEYSKEIEPVKKEQLNKVFKSYVVEALKNLVKIPFSPLIGICEGVYSLIVMLTKPLHTAKTNAAQADLECQFASDADPNDPGLAFAKKAALDRFSERMKALQKPEEVAAQHFMQTQQEKDNVMAEVLVKREKYNAGIQAMKNNPVQLERGEKAQTKFVKTVCRRIEAYAEYEIELRKADTEQAQAMNFDPTTITIKIEEEEAAEKAKAAAVAAGNDAPAAPEAGKPDENLAKVGA
jgi:hypothetical protein